MAVAKGGMPGDGAQAQDMLRLCSPSFLPSFLPTKGSSDNAADAFPISVRAFGLFRSDRNFREMISFIIFNNATCGALAVVQDQMRTCKKGSL